MRRTAITLLLLGLLAPAFANPPEDYPFLRFDEAMARADADEKLLFVYFGRYGCAYCDRTNKEAFTDPAVREKYTNHYVLAYVDAESGRRLRLPSGERVSERELGTRHSDAVTPVFFFVTPGGTWVMKLVGLQSRDDLLEADRKIQEALAKIATQ